MIQLKDITKIYKPKKGNKVIALDNINLTLANKSLVFIVGKSGSGKSTLLNIIGGLDKFDKGEIYFGKKKFSKLKAKEINAYRNTNVGFIFQDYNLLEEYNVYQNVELPMNLQKKKISKESLNKLLNNIGISSLGKRKPNELSGGQKQRVAIARAIVKRPDIILADEPTGNLDTINSNQIFDLLKDISREKLVIVVSHDVDSAFKYGDRVIELSDGKVINDSKQNEILNEDKTVNFVSSHLSFFKTFFFALKNIQRKKLKLFFTTLLVTFSLFIFGVASTLSYFSFNKTHAKTLIAENNTNIQIEKHILENSYTLHSDAINFTKEEVNNIEKNIGKSLTQLNRINEGNNYIYPEFAQKSILFIFFKQQFLR